MEINFKNYKQITKELVKGKNLTKATVEMLDSIFFWALHNKSKKNTVKIRGVKQVMLLKRLEDNGFIKTYHIYFRKLNYIGAEIITDCELNSEL